jgi:hypothetical protein
MPKYSKKFNKGWKFYLEHADKFSFCGQLPVEFEYDPSAPDAKEVFFNWESGYGLTPTCEPDLLKKVHNCKASINFHIKMWTQGFEDVMEPIEFYMDSFKNPPKWVEKALKNSIIRKYGPGSELWFTYRGK